MIPRHEYPELSHVETSEGVAYFVTVDQQVGTLLRLRPIDLEGPGFDAASTAFSQVLSRMKAGIRLRIMARATPTKEYPWATFRREAITRLGWTQHELFVAIETEPRTSTLRRIAVSRFGRRRNRSFEREISFIRESIDWTGLKELGAEPIAGDALLAYFPPYSSEWTQTSNGIETASHHVGVLRLWRQGSRPIDREALAILREDFVPPYEIVVTTRKLPEARSQYLLQRKRGQMAASGDSLSAHGLEKTEEALAATLLDGGSLLAMEWLLILRRTSEAELKDDIAACARALERVGDVIHEVSGSLPSWLSAFPGGATHHSFLELDSLAPLYCPVAARGEAPEHDAPPGRTLALHRRDGSLYHFDLFRKGYDGANCIINGRRGKGKSVLANLISSSLLEDPEIRLIKVDVGGSYVKECDLHGGRQVQFNLSEPSGLNPFRLVRETPQAEDAATILTALMGTLILESKETVLSKELQGELERRVLAYIEVRRESPTLADFLDFASDLPRKALLERFAPGGVFGNVLREPEGSRGLSSNRYVYFNFERLQNAADEDFAQAVMAAVIATVNLEMLQSGDARRGAKQRLVFFADETPFFIQRNGRFFKLTTANFRKFGHGTVLIAQTTQDLVLPKEGGGSDHGILVNSGIRFFYQVDDEPEAFLERFGLTARQIEEIHGLGRTESYREVFLQDELGGRVLRVAVTPEEYWRVTSSRTDNEKLQALIRAVPGLGLQEAIRCLSV